MTSRVVSFAGSSVRIDADGRQAIHVVDFLFRDLPAAGHPPPHVTLEVRGADADGALTLHVGGVRLYAGQSAGALARALVERTAFHLSDRSSGGLLLHAAAVADGTGAIVFPGKSGTGKSTLTAWLAASGYRYLTDELVYIPTGTSDVIPFPRPLNIRAAGLAALESTGAAVIAPDSERLSAPGLTLVRPPAGRDDVSPGAVRAAAVVFPCYEAGAALAASAISKAEAGLGLMASLINARNLPGHGHAEVARLAREVPAFRVTYADVGAVEAWLAHLAPRGASRR